jgi:hypothetical protein
MYAKVCHRRMVRTDTWRWLPTFYQFDDILFLGEISSFPCFSTDQNKTNQISSFPCFSTDQNKTNQGGHLHQQLEELKEKSYRDH